jgi:hypothetical protein
LQRTREVNRMIGDTRLKTDMMTVLRGRVGTALG